MIAKMHISSTQHNTESRSLPSYILWALMAIVLTPNVLFLLQPFFLDEWAILRNVITFISQKTIAPYHAQYPTLYSYIVAPAIPVSAAITYIAGLGNSIRETVEILYFTRPDILIMPARVISLLALTAGAGIMFRFVKNRYDWLSAFFVFSITVSSFMFLQYGSYGLPDTTMFFFCTLSLVYVFKASASKSRSFVKNMLFASALCGVAISSKYNAVSAVCPIAFMGVYALVVGKIDWKEFFLTSIGSSVVCCLFFLLGSPGWIISTDFFVQEFVSVREHAKVGHLGFTGIPFLGHTELLLSKAGFILIPSLLGILLWIRKPDIAGLIAAISFFSIFVLAGISAKQSLHYLYPGMAGLLFFAAHFHYKMNHLGKHVRYLVTAVVVGMSFTMSAWASVQYLKSNSTSQATAWIKEQIPENSAIAVDWAYVPDVYSQAMLDEIEQTYSQAPLLAIKQQNLTYVVEDIEPNVGWLNQTQADFIVTSSQVHDRFFNFGTFTRIKPSPDDGIYKEFEAQSAFYSALFSSPNWQEAASFATGNGPRTQIFERIK